MVLGHNKQMDKHIPCVHLLLNISSQFFNAYHIGAPPLRFIHFYLPFLFIHWKLSSHIMNSGPEKNQQKEPNEEKKMYEALCRIIWMRLLHRNIN